MRGDYEMLVKMGPNWIPLDRYRVLRAERRRELIKGIAFIVLITVVLFGLLWMTP